MERSIMNSVISAFLMRRKTKNPIDHEEQLSNTVLLSKVLGAFVSEVLLALFFICTSAPRVKQKHSETKVKILM